MRLWTQDLLAHICLPWMVTSRYACLPAHPPLIPPYPLLVHEEQSPGKLRKWIRSYALKRQNSSLNLTNLKERPGFSAILLSSRRSRVQGVAKALEIGIHGHHKSLLQRAGDLKAWPDAPWNSSTSTGLEKRKGILSVKSNAKTDDTVGDKTSILTSDSTRV